MMLVLQAVQTVPEGPAWLAAVAISVPSVLGAVKLGMGLKANGRTNGHDSEKSIEFRATTNQTLSRLTQIADRQTENMALLGKTMDLLTVHVQQHDTQTASAIGQVEDMHRMVEDMHRRTAK